MLNLVLITYNDAGFIEKCISSVIDHVDRIIAVDGRFADFPHEPGEPAYSTDGTLEYLSSIEKVEVILGVCPELEEVEKRNHYLIADEGDWYLHLDADEWVENPELLGELPDVDVVFCQMRWPNRFHRYPRLFKHYEGLHYEGLHYRLEDKDGDLYCDIQTAGEKYTSTNSALLIRHERDSRSPERKKRKAAYYSVLTKREKRVKEMILYGN